MYCTVKIGGRFNKHQLKCDSPGALSVSSIQVQRREGMHYTCLRTYPAVTPSGITTLCFTGNRLQFAGIATMTRGRRVGPAGAVLGELWFCCSFTTTIAPPTTAPPSNTRPMMRPFPGAVMYDFWAGQQVHVSISNFRKTQYIFTSNRSFYFNFERLLSSRGYIDCVL